MKEDITGNDQHAAFGISSKLTMEIVIRRTISLILFVILLFSPIIIIEESMYIIRFMINGNPQPNRPYAFEFLYRMWH